jgi:hypothetical protein
LILPSSGPDLETAAKLAETAVTVATNHSDMPWFRFAKGLAEYRQGHFASAVEWMQKVQADAGPVVDRDAEACMVLAMAQYRLKQADTARATFGKGSEIVNTQLPKLESGDFGNWIDWIIAHALLREATALIEDQPAKPK